MSENLYDEENRNEMYRLQKMMNNLTCGHNERTVTMKDFQVQNALGKGAYGNVYRVRSIRDGKDYALKQIGIQLEGNGVPQSVLREISVMKQLARKSHPNILSLKAVFHNTDHVRKLLKINMILERCDWDLYTFLKGIPRGVPEKQARHVTQQIVKGLDFLHSHSIIHRDLKPQNILVNRDQTIKLADFGLSKEYSNTTAFTTLVVTLWYRSPEVLLQSYYTSSLDMWAVGCIVSEIYNREPLFCGADEAHQLSDIFKKIGTPNAKEWPSEAVIARKSFPNFPPQNLRSFNPYLTGEALDFVQQCLRFDPKKRLSSRVGLSHPFLKPQVSRSRILQPIHMKNK